MLWKKVGRSFIGILVILSVAALSLAQLIDIGKFKGIVIPYTLKYQDKVIEKGRYDLETLKNPNTPSCYLRFKKKDKVIALVEGERLTLEVRGIARFTDSSISQKPRLKMKKDAMEKVLIFMVETGRDSMFPYLLLRFKLKYEEE